MPLLRLPMLLALAVKEEAGAGAAAEATLRRAVALAEAAHSRRAGETAFAVGPLAAFLKCAAL